MKSPYFSLSLLLSSLIVLYYHFYCSVPSTADSLPFTLQFTLPLNLLFLKQVYLLINISDSLLFTTSLSLVTRNQDPILFKGSIRSNLDPFSQVHTLNSTIRYHYRHQWYHHWHPHWYDWHRHIIKCIDIY